MLQMERWQRRWSAGEWQSFLAEAESAADLADLRRFTHTGRPLGSYAFRSHLLSEIATELAKLPADRAPGRRDWSRLSSQWTTRIDERIAELERLKSGLTECIGCGCLSLDRCALSNPDDRMGKRGPGPRFWIGDRPGS